MDCRRFQKLIPDFINDSMELDDMEAFVRHSKECAECFDELEIYYMLYEGLDKIENDAKASFDLKGELSHKLAMYEEETYTLYKMKVIGGVAGAVAQILLAVCISLHIWNWLR